MIKSNIEVAGKKLIAVDYDPRHTVIHSLGAEVGLNLLEDCLYLLPENGET